MTGLLMFEAAARHQSFTRAAEELGVTQAAVSQQIKLLERELGVGLFVRLHRGIEITRAGNRLHRAVVMGLEYIAETAENVRKQERSPAINIGVTFAVATFWLVRRLPEFRARHPELDIHIIASDRGFDAVADQADAGIAYGEGQWPGFSATLLRRDMVFPVCSPSYLRRRKLTHIEQLKDETLLSQEDNRAGLLTWPQWFARLSVRVPAVSKSLKFNSYPLLLQAACEGQGIALGWSLLVDDLLASKTLIRPLEVALESPKAFYFVRSTKDRSPGTLAFQTWLSEQLTAVGERVTTDHPRLPSVRQKNSGQPWAEPGHGATAAVTPAAALPSSVPSRSGW